MTTFERLVTELGDGLGISLVPDSADVVRLYVENRLVLLHPDETRERELTVFSTVAVAPEGGFPPATLKRALAMNLFGREVVGHHLGLFADSLVLSASIPLADLSAEDLADRIVMLARLAGTLSGSFESAAPTVEAAASMSLDAGGFIAV